MTDEVADSPIEGQVMLVASAKASVTGSELPALVRRVQAHLADRVGEYGSRFEEVHADPPDRYFLAPTGHWSAIGEGLDLDGAEVDAVRRAHAEQLLWAGRRIGRRDEFESAMDIRDVVVIRDTAGSDGG